MGERGKFGKIFLKKGNLFIYKFDLAFYWAWERLRKNFSLPFLPVYLFPVVLYNSSLSVGFSGAFISSFS